MQTEQTDPIAAAAARMMRRLDRLATCTDGPGLTRLPFTPAHQAAVALVSEWMRQAGLTVGIDAAGTLVGRRDGPPGAPALLIGSHLDTVRDAGRFDGAFGVLCGLAALEVLAGGPALPFAVEVLGFADEEGVRFPTTLIGSRALAGRLDMPALAAARDVDGIGLLDALAAFGGDPAALPAVARDPAGVLAYLEPHIEQGPVLERAGLALGVVSAINGATRLRLVVTGRAGHAGTEPMAGRRDALAAAAEMVGAVRAVGLSDPALTATVGRLVAEPGAVNVIAGRAEFSLDLRAPDDGMRAAARAEILHRLRTIATAHGVRLDVETMHEADAAPCATLWQRRLHAAIAGCGQQAATLTSGAGHDAMVMAQMCPAAMLFVRCRDGLSHHPDEHLDGEDARLALAAVTRLIEDQARQT